MTNTKSKYKTLCQKESLPIFMSFDWLEAIYSDISWDVSLVEKGGNIMGAMPYFYKRKWGMNIITMAPLTPYLGYWIDYPPQQKYTKRLSHEKKIMTQFIEQLPKYDYFVQHWQPYQSNWLPFYWKDFQQTTRYTYIIEDLSDLDSIHKAMRGNIRRQIKKGNRNLTIGQDLPLEDFYALHEKAFRAKDKKMPFSKDYLLQLNKVAAQKECKKLLYATAEDGTLHAAIYIVWDNQFCHYLLGAANPEVKNLGGMSLLLWEAIQFASNVTEKFNFEGSMIEPIERFFRAFGAKQVPYYRIEKVNNPLIQLGSSVRDLI